MARHASLADQLQGLIAYRARPEGPSEPVKTNWPHAADNDNAPEDKAGLHIERRRQMRPTVDEIMREVEDGEVEYGTHVDDNGREHRVITAIGKLKFSDGSQKEKAFRYSVDGKLIQYDAPMPVGAMLGTKDAQERVLGGDTIVSNRAYTQVYKAKHPGRVTRKSKEARAAEAPAPERTKAELRAEIEALEKPPATICKPGFPWRPSNLREIFFGLEKTASGESGSVAWEDISTHIATHEAMIEAAAAISPEDKATLDAAMTAKSMTDVGRANGYRGKHAERKGKERLIAANDNYMAAIRKLSA